MAKNRIKMVLGMSFFTFSKANIRFAKKKLVWRAYSSVKTLFITQKIKIIDRKEFATAILIEKNKMFVINIATISIKIVSNIHLFQQA